MKVGPSLHTAMLGSFLAGITLRVLRMASYRALVLVFSFGFLEATGSMWQESRLELDWYCCWSGSVRLSTEEVRLEISEWGNTWQLVGNTGGSVHQLGLRLSGL